MLEVEPFTSPMLKLQGPGEGLLSFRRNVLLIAYVPSVMLSVPDCIAMASRFAPPLSVALPVRLRYAPPPVVGAMAEVMFPASARFDATTGNASCSPVLGN